jgi:hypothetical protein
VLATNSASPSIASHRLHPDGALRERYGAHAVSFFASEAAGFITGRRVVVDGGRGLAA